MTSCSIEALAVGEPLPGTAPHATGWIVLEQPGSWGRDAVSESQLDPRVAAFLADADRSGIKVLMARHPDRPSRRPDGTRHAWVARSIAGAHLLRHGILDSIDEVLTWDLEAMGAGHLPVMGSLDPRPTTFVCTHSKRDRCCALDGRALITDLLADVEPTERLRIWECSHVGGHRFAPVMLSLPSGAVHGRVDGQAAREVIDLATRHEVLVDRLRGLSGFSPAFQVAAIGVMRAEGLARDDDLDVLRIVNGRAIPVKPGAPHADVTATVAAEVRHTDGRSWRATVERVPLAEDRRESCSKEPVSGFAWECTALAATTPWS